MLNTTSNTAAQSTKVSNILLYAHVEQVKEPEVGYIFSAQNFAKDWDSIYVRPSQLQLGEAKEGMRKLTSPTLVITSHSNSMAYILASEKMPVYIPSSLRKDKEGYLIAARLAPIVTPEYMFYMCQFEKWNHTIASCLDPEDWNSVGISNYDLENNREIVIEPLDIIRNTCAIEGLPSVKRQKEMVADAKEQETDIEALVNNTKPYNVSELISRYMMCALSRNVFSKSGLSLLLECYLTAAGDKANDEVKDILFRNDFVEGILSQEEMAFLASHLEDVFQQVVASNGMKYESSFGFIQPQEVTDFMCSLVSCPQDTIVYNPFAGANSYAIALPNPVVGEERIAETWALGQIRLFAAGATSRTNIKLGDSFATMSDDKKYKAIITSPAYLMEKGQRIGDIVSHLYDKLEDGGTLVCIVSAGFLFDQSQASKSIRTKLVEDKALKAVISLPSNIFNGTGISQAAIVISKGIENEDIVFADASGYTRFAKSVYRQTTFDWEQFVKDMEDDLVDFGERGEYVVDDDVATIVKYSYLNDCNLIPEIYLTPRPKNGKPLSDFASEIKECRGDGNTEYNLVGSSLPEALHRKPFAPQKCVEKKATSARNHVAIYGDAVLIAIVSGKVRTVFVENFHNKIAFPPGFIKVLQPADGVSAQYLAALLSTKVVANQITAHAKGLTIARLNRLDLSQVFVPDYQSEEERQKLINDVLTAEMGDMALELHEAHERYKREVRSTRHAMIQTLSALSSNWQQMNMFAQKKGGQISFNDIVGRVNPISVENLMGTIGYAISTLEQQVESLRLEKADWGEEVEINPYGFIEDYIRTHSTPNVRMVNVGNDNTADIPDINEETGDVTYYHTDAMNVFTAPMRLVERIFNNIVANAKAHGFSSDKSDNEIRFDWQEVHGDIVITIANNGLPLKEGVTSDDVLMSGFSTALNESSSEGTLHSGQGGFEIKSLMEGLGSVEVKSEPNAEFPVIYRLIFTNTNTVRIL
jgi:hypothetical protein